VISPGYPTFKRGSTQYHHYEHHNDRHAASPDRWLVGLVAGAVLMYLLGKARGLATPHRHASRPDTAR
jgi:hypothetical protein